MLLKTRIFIVLGLMTVMFAAAPARAVTVNNKLPDGTHSLGAAVNKQKSTGTGGGTGSWTNNKANAGNTKDNAKNNNKGTGSNGGTGSGSGDKKKTTGNGAGSGAGGRNNTNNNKGTSGNSWIQGINLDDFQNEEAGAYSQKHETHRGDVNATDDYDKRFEKPHGKFYHVCLDEDKNKSGKTEKCIDNVFDETQVQMLQADGLIKLYLKKQGVTDIECSPSRVRSWNDDYVACVDDKRRVAYDFKFDDVRESIDSTVQRSVAAAVCKMNGGNFSRSASLDDVCKGGNCANVRDDLQLFGYSAMSAANSDCIINYREKTQGYSDLHAPYGIDINKFKNLQIQAGANLPFLLSRYATRKVHEAGEKVTSWRCNHSFNTYASGNIFKSDNDDILTCYVNNQAVDFVFDDINESWDITADGGAAGLQCIADMGGVFDGKNCSGLTKSQCATLATKIEARWDSDLETCVMPAAGAAENLRVAQDVAIAAGILIGVSLVAVATAGTGTVVLVAVGNAVSMTGTVASIQGQLMQDDDARKLVAGGMNCINSGKCSECAPAKMKEFLNSVAAYRGDLTPQLLDAVDETAAGLYNCLAPGSQIVKDFNKKLKESPDGDTCLQMVDKWDTWPSGKKLNCIGASLQALGAVIDIVGGLGEFVHAIKGLQAIGGVATSGKLLRVVVKKGVNDAVGNAVGAWDNYNSVSSLVQ